MLHVTAKDKAQVIARWEAQGATQIRLLLQSGKIASQWIPLASEWLAGKEAELERIRAAAEGKQIEIAVSAKDAAWTAAKAAEVQAREARRANTRATIALVIATVSLIATIAIGAIGLHPH